MDDLVMEMRDAARHISSVGLDGWGATLNDGADEIERLRQQLADKDARIAQLEVEQSEHIRPCCANPETCSQACIHRGRWLERHENSIAKAIANEEGKEG